MKNQTTPANWMYLFVIPAFFLPFLYVHHATAQWNPFLINGKRFLWFYGYCLMAGYATVLLPVLLRRCEGLFPLMRGMAMALLTLGMARLCQGIFHGKPVGYLVLLLISLLVMWQLIRRWYIKKR